MQGESNGHSQHVASTLAVSVLLVERTAFYRQLLREALEIAGVVAVYEARDLAEAVEIYLLRKPDLVVLDGSGSEGVATARAVSARFESPRMVAIEVSANGLEVYALAAAGVRGFVTSEGSVESLVLAIEAVVSGSAACPAQIASVLFSQLASCAPVAVPEPERLLTPRELEVLELMGGGMPNKQIALQLSIELATVKNHVHHILKKLGLSNRAEVGAWARRNARIPVPRERELTRAIS
jgi:DNA-binding NarL/FixJ family response regulator